MRGAVATGTSCDERQRETDPARPATARVTARVTATAGSRQRTHTAYQFRDGHPNRLPDRERVGEYRSADMALHPGVRRWLSTASNTPNQRADSGSNKPQDRAVHRRSDKISATSRSFAVTLLAPTFLRGRHGRMLPARGCTVECRSANMARIRVLRARAEHAITTPAANADPTPRTSRTVRRREHTPEPGRERGQPGLCRTRKTARRAVKA